MGQKSCWCCQRLGEMLNSLSIRNVVLIDKLDLDFESGLSILTGETGAGKSILLDSLGLLLGSRAETSLIRHGQDKLSVAASFGLPEAHHPLFALAKDFDLELDEQIVIKRSLSSDGKGKIFINDQPVTAKFLKEFGTLLVEIHGQFDNHGLLNPANHREILDNYGNYPKNLKEVGEAFVLYKKAQEERKKTEDSLAKARIDEDNIKHWLSELQKLNPQIGEEEELSRRRLEMMNAEKILDSMSYAYNSLTQGKDILSAIRQAQSAIDKANRVVEGKYAAIVDILEQVFVNADEAVQQIEEASSSLSLNQNEVDNIEQRLFALRGAARKHQVQIVDLPVLLEKMRQQLSQIELGEDGLLALQKQEQLLRLQYIALAKELSQKRKTAAEKLDKNVMAELPPLKMEKAKFVTQIEDLPENLWGEKGVDAINFTVSTNPNSAQGALNKIASGGELARFMLALKVNLAASSQNMTMIFDELDTGVGGATAQAVGERLLRLSQDVQVLLVTHSPQVAACGNNHFKVEKNTTDNITTTYVKKLDKNARFEEIARMLAGEIITDEARAAAKVLMK